MHTLRATRQRGGSRDCRAGELLECIHLSSSPTTLIVSSINQPLHVPFIRRSGRRAIKATDIDTQKLIGNLISEREKYGESTEAFGTGGTKRSFCEDGETVLESVRGGRRGEGGRGSGGGGRGEEGKNVRYAYDGSFDGGWIGFEEGCTTRQKRRKKTVLVLKLYWYSMSDNILLITPSLPSSLPLRARRGLFAGKDVLFGNMVSHSNRK